MNQIPGGWYIDYLPTGERVVLIRGSHLEHNGHRVELPVATLPDGSRIEQNCLFPRLSPDGKKFAGVGNSDDLCWQWDAGWSSHGIAFGPNAVIYDVDGNLNIVLPPVAHGWRSVGDDGRLVTCNDTIHDSSLRIWEYTETGGVVFGQGGNGPHGDDPCIVLIGGKRRLLSEGRCRFIRVHRGLDQFQQEQFAVAFVREDQNAAQFQRLTRVDLLRLPEIAADIPPVKPKPIPLEQVEPLVGKWLVSYYEQNRNVPEGKLPPGNAMVAVRNQEGQQPRPMILTFETEGKVTGTVIGFRIGSEPQFLGEVVTIEVMEQRARAVAAKGYRPWFYWDSREVPRWPSLPPGSVIELNAFCGRDEPIADFEQAMEALIRRAVIETPYLLCLAVQTHTTNLSLLREPSQAIPSIIRLCQRWRVNERFLGINVFNNSGRDDANTGEGGLTANPQLRPHWTKVFSGVTGLPANLRGVVVGNGGGGGGNVSFTIVLGPYPRKFVRGDPASRWGFDVPWDIDSDRPIVKRRFQMNDGSVAKIVDHTITVGADGRWERGVRYKPDRNGTPTFTVTMWDDQGNEASVTSEPVTVTSIGGGGGTGGGPGTIKEYRDYFAQRWREMGIDRQSQAIADREGFANLDAFEKLNPDNPAIATDPSLWDQARYNRIADECKSIQCPALIRIAGELHHHQGHRDVGLNVKEHGNRWTDPRIPRSIATDIIAIKPSDGDGNVVPGNFHIIDTMFAVGTPFTRPDWGSHGENHDASRPWIEPPQP